MESILSLIGLATAGLLAVAIGVAWWEQIGSRAAARRTLHATPRHAVSVDVKLDELAGEPARAASDQAARQAALGTAMARMARATPSPTSLAWMDTQPTVAAGLRQGPESKVQTPGAESGTRH
jgi:hypothetical protein